MNDYVKRALSWIARHVENDEEYADAIGCIFLDDEMIVEVLAYTYDIEVNDTYDVEPIEELVEIARESARKILY